MTEQELFEMRMLQTELNQLVFDMRAHNASARTQKSIIPAGMVAHATQCLGRVELFTRRSAEPPKPKVYRTMGGKQA